MAENAVEALSRASRIVARAVAHLEAGQVDVARRGLIRLGAYLADEAEDLAVAIQDGDVGFLDDLATLADLGHPIADVLPPVHPDELLAVEPAELAGVGER